MTCCRDIESELVSFCKDELTPAERAEVEAHLAQCAACRAELASIEQTFGALRKDLVPIELSAHFRIALTDRIDQATQAATPAGLHVVRSSERHIRDMKRPLVTRLYDHARRSPYFAASVFLHAAAALLIVAVFLQVNNTQPGTGTVVIEQTPVAAHPLDDERQTLQAAWRIRREAPSFTTRAVVTPNGLAVDVAQSMTEDGPAVLIADDVLQCVMIFPVDRENTPSGEALQAKLPGAVMGSIQNARVRIPSTVARDFVSADNDLRVFQLARRLEIWGEPRWTEVDRTFGAGIGTAGIDIPAHLVAAILPKRDEWL